MTTAESRARLAHELRLAIQHGDFGAIDALLRQHDQAGPKGTAERATLQGETRPAACDATIKDRERQRTS